MAQPWFGATAGYFSRRAGASRRAWLAASLFPSVVMLGLWFAVLAMGILVGRNAHVLAQPGNIFWGAFTLALLPGLALLLGALTVASVARQPGKSEGRENSGSPLAGQRCPSPEIQTARKKKKEGEIMNRRTKHIWLPGLMSLAAAMVLLMILIQISLQPRFLGRSPLYMVLLPWLVLLPLCGASGAYQSRRGGGPRWTRLAAGLFPSIALLALGSILTLTRLVVLAQPRWWYGSLAVMIGIVLPTAALLLGALPFLKAGKLQEL
jgi:hypothetical protein